MENDFENYFRQWVTYCQTYLDWLQGKFNYPEDVMLRTIFPPMAPFGGVYNPEDAACILQDTFEEPDRDFKEVERIGKVIFDLNDKVNDDEFYSLKKFRGDRKVIEKSLGEVKAILLPLDSVETGQEKVVEQTGTDPATMLPEGGQGNEAPIKDAARADGPTLKAIHTGNLLRGWKEIADYMRVSKGTAQKREKMGWPIRRQGKIITALRSELDLYELKLLKQ